MRRYPTIDEAVGPDDPDLELEMGGVPRADCYVQTDRDLDSNASSDIFTIETVTRTDPSTARASVDYTADHFSEIRVNCYTDNEYYKGYHCLVSSVV